MDECPWWQVCPNRSRWLRRSQHRAIA